RRRFFILRCRLFLPLRSRIRQASDCSPANRERELGLDRRETVLEEPQVRTFGSRTRSSGRWCEATISGSMFEHPVADASCSLTSAERKYSATERELLGVIFGIEHFRGYVEGMPFTVVTDCAALKWLHHTGRLARWCMRLSQFDFIVQYRSGKLNVIPDALSRSISSLNIESFQPDEWYLNMIKQVKDDPDKFSYFKVEGQYLYKFVPSALPIRGNIPDWKLVVPTANRSQILKQFHDDLQAAHFGVSKILSRISELYYWQSIIPKIWLNARYHPQTKPTERVNRVLVTAISSYIKDSHREWDKYIFEIAEAIRSVRHDSTQVSPNELVFGRHVPIYGDLYNPVDLDKPLEIGNKLFWEREMAQLPELY
ncbi:hypothetical protein ILUMI_14051, partial [Ignelater luminosus]